MTLTYTGRVAVHLASLPDPGLLLDLRSTRIAVAELVLLAIGGGVLGTYVVLRRLAFFSHAVGSATFPALVASQAVRISPRLAALGMALAYAAGTALAARRGRDPGGAATALTLVACLGAGTILASDVYHSGAGVDQLLFGSAIGLSGGDLLTAGAAAALAVAAAALLGRTWSAVAFDPAGAPALGIPGRRADAALLLVLAAAVVAALPAVGALLATSLFVVPSAIARLFARSVGELLGLSVVLGLAQALLGLYGSIWLDIPPGPAIAVLGAGAYAIAARAGAVPRVQPAEAPA
jgi:ABC-type Mn2+/Zn2+ transport system permease subunit